MTSDPINFCLQRLTDYREFERLCCALLSYLDYPSIDPLGGTGDDGRDAILRDDGQGGAIVFAFTVRVDWFPKLKWDSSQVHKKQTGISKLVYACTSYISARDKDKAVKYIQSTYACHLDLFDIERLRTILVTHPHLITHHPAIFDPRYFQPQPQNFSQHYLLLYARLLDWLARSDDDLATEIDASYYNALRDFVRESSQVELVCPDETTLTVLKSLHNAVKMVWDVISDDHYILSNWRYKFNNMEQPNVNVQAILREKKLQIIPLREKVSEALQSFAELARR